jgi:hypothetical protein
VIAGVKVVGDLLHLLDPDIGGEEGVQGTVKLRRIPPGWKGDRGHLARSVDSAVGPPGADHRKMPAGDLLQGRLHLALDRPAPGLELPTHEIGAVVMDGQPKAAVIVGIHAGQGREVGGNVKKDWPGTDRFDYPYAVSLSLASADPGL